MIYPANGPRVASAIPVPCLHRAVLRPICVSIPDESRALSIHRHTIGSDFGTDYCLIHTLVGRSLQREPVSSTDPDCDTDSDSTNTCFARGRTPVVRSRHLHRAVNVDLDHDSVGDTAVALWRSDTVAHRLTWNVCPTERLPSDGSLGKSRSVCGPRRTHDVITCAVTPIVRTCARIDRIGTAKRVASLPRREVRVLTGIDERISAAHRIRMTRAADIPERVDVDAVIIW